jgi:hypothetical protein
MNKTSAPAVEKPVELQGKIDRLAAASTAVAEKNFTIFFYTPDVKPTTSGAIIELYQLAATFRRAGYDAVMITEEKEYEVPVYLDEDLQALPHKASIGLTVKPEDMLIIPEYFTSVIAKTSKMPCTRVVLVQGYDNSLATMIPGNTWNSLGIRHVWTMSQPLSTFVREVIGGNYALQTLRIGIPAYFKPVPVKDPIIAVQVRNALDLQKISSEFYLRYPELRWVGFEPLTALGRTRREYAHLLAKASVVLWVDRIAAFGQTAVEAMATQTPMVALLPDHDPEYYTDSNAVWVDRLPHVATRLGQLFKLQLESGLPEWLTPAMAETAAAYTPERAEQTALSVLDNTLKLRTAELSDLILQYKGKLDALNTPTPKTAR